MACAHRTAGRRFLRGDACGGDRAVSGYRLARAAPPRGRPAMTRGRTRAVNRRSTLVATLALAVAFLPILLTGALAVQLQDELGFGPTALGAGFAIFFGVAMVASAPIGRLVDRVGHRRSLYVATLVSAVVALGVAALAHTWLVLALLLALAGAGVGFTQPAANRLIAQATPPGRQGLALGIKQSGIPLATLIGGFTVPALAVTVGWRWGYVAAAALAAVTAAGVTTVPGEAGVRAVRGPADAPARPDRRRTLVLLAVGLGLGSAAASSSGAFAVATAVDGGFTESGAAVLYAAASVGGILTRLGAGHAADRRRPTELAWVAGMLLAGAAGYLLLAGGTIAGIWLGLPLAIALGWGWLGLFDLALVRGYPETVGSVTGRLWVGAFLGGGLGPLATGALAERRSLATSWAALTVVAVLAAGCMAMVALQRRRAPVPMRAPRT
jgi:nitrate/nitrite transporter NarK